MRRNRAPMAVLEPLKGIREDKAAAAVWARFLESNLDRFRRTVRAPMGELLGCGLFGCVFASESPWVVKITRDPTEGEVWAYMAELLADPEVSSELDAYLRVKDVVRIRPDVIFKGEQMPVFGIVREEALPVLIGDDVASSETLRHVGVTSDMLARAGVQSPSLNDISVALERFPEPSRTRIRELFVVLLALQRYRKHALEFYKWRGMLTRRDYGGLEREEAEEISDAAFRDMLDAIATMRGDGYVNQFGEEIGQTLLASVQFGDLVFRDLHLLNVGWRIHETIDGDTRPRCMVILDPGAMATPYSPDIREIELLENRAPYRGPQR